MTSAIKNAKGEFFAGYKAPARLGSNRFVPTFVEVKAGEPVRAMLFKDYDVGQHLRTLKEGYQLDGLTAVQFQS